MDDDFKNHAESSDDEDDGDCDQERQELPPPSPPPQPPHGTGVLGLWWPPLSTARGGTKLPVPPSPSMTPPPSTSASAPPPPLSPGPPPQPPPHGGVMGLRWPPLPPAGGAHPAFLRVSTGVPTPLVGLPPLRVSSWQPPAPAPTPTKPHVSPPAAASTSAPSPAPSPPCPQRAGPRSRPGPRPPQEYNCRYCPFRSDEADLKNHLSRRHANKKSSRCPNCGCRFKNDFLTHKC